MFLSANHLEALLGAESQARLNWRSSWFILNLKKNRVTHTGYVASKCACVLYNIPQPFVVLFDLLQRGSVDLGLVFLHWHIVSVVVTLHTLQRYREIKPKRQCLRSSTKQPLSLLWRWFKASKLSSLYLVWRAQGRFLCHLRFSVCEAVGRSRNSQGRSKPLRSDGCPPPGTTWACLREERRGEERRREESGRTDTFKYTI